MQIPTAVVYVYLLIYKQAGDCFCTLIKTNIVCDRSVGDNLKFNYNLDIGNTDIKLLNCSFYSLFFGHFFCLLFCDDPC